MNNYNYLMHWKINYIFNHLKDISLFVDDISRKLTQKAQRILQPLGYL